METKTTFKSLFEMINTLQTEEDCVRFFIEKRWSGGVKCPHCLHTKIYKYSNGKVFKCAACKTQFTYKTGTCLEYCKIPMKKVFMGIYYLLQHTDGISSYEMAADLGITQKTAWYLAHRIREVLSQMRLKKPLTGIVESDDTYVGGKNGNRHFDKKVKNSQGRSYKDKVPVIGLLQRQGELRTMVVRKMTGKHTIPFIIQNLDRDAILMTDEWRGFLPLSKVYNHKIVVHKKKQYVDGDCYTNTLEGFWRQLKDSLRAKYHLRIKPKHLQRYVDEVTFRYNTRNMSLDGKLNTFFNTIGGHIRYITLISS